MPPRRPNAIELLTRTSADCAGDADPIRPIRRISGSMSGLSAFRRLIPDRRRSSPLRAAAIVKCCPVFNCD